MMPTTHHVAAVCHDGHIRLIEQTLAPLSSGMVLVRVRNSLISPGTELGSWEQLAQRRKNPVEQTEPRRFGYSNAGEVQAVGEGVTQFSTGQRVACIGAGYALHGEYSVVPQNLCFALPEEVSFSQGSYAMLSGTALHAVRRLEPQLGEFAAVLGLGLVGQLVGQLLQLAGVEVIGWEKLGAREEIARQWGIEQTVNVRNADPVQVSLDFTGGAGLDAAVLAFGGDAGEAYKKALASLKVSPDGHSMGRIVVVGQAMFQSEWTTSNHDIRVAARTGPGYHDENWESGADYPPVFMPWTTRTNVERCLRWIGQGKLNVDILSTHRVQLSEVDEATSGMLERPEGILGVIFEMNE